MRIAVPRITHCPNCGKELTALDYDVDHDEETGDPYLFILCSNCVYDERFGKVMGRKTPCDYGPCPYNAEYSDDCRRNCGLGVDE